jgi:hypothetical protein
MAEASAAVLAIADAVRAEYQRLKLTEVVLDYDDLIDKAQNLLSRADAASWVLYKIDGGIDHILVDEAQDTNPAQWAIIENLAAEFFAGAGRSERLRTLFAVGDEKQSIYSFQGANPCASAKSAARSGNGRRRSHSPGTTFPSRCPSARPRRSSMLSISSLGRRPQQTGCSSRRAPSSRMRRCAKETRGSSNFGRSKPRKRRNLPMRSSLGTRSLPGRAVA